MAEWWGENSGLGDADGPEPHGHGQDLIRLSVWCVIWFTPYNTSVIVPMSLLQMNKLKFTAQSFILQPRKLIPWDAEWLTQGHTGGKGYWVALESFESQSRTLFPHISAPKWTSFEESYSGALKAMLCCQIFSVDYGMSFLVRGLMWKIWRWLTC